MIKREDRKQKIYKCRLRIGEDRRNTHSLDLDVKASEESYGTKMYNTL